MKNIYIFLVFIASFSFGQTGPAGVGSTDGTSDLKLWLNAQNVVVSGSSITTLNDLSGYSSNLIQSTAGSQPQLNTSWQNAMPSMTFDGTGDFLEDADGENYINGENAFTVFIVFQSDIVGTDNGLFNSQNPDGGDDSFSLRYDDAGASGGQNDVLKGATGGSNQFETAANTQTSTPQIVTYYWTSPSLPAVNFQGQATTMSAGGASNGPIAGATTFMLGKGTKDIGSSGWDGEIAEYIYFDVELNSAQIRLVENYLSSKYDIALTFGDIYSGDLSGSGEYDHDVFGIGTEADGSNLLAGGGGLYLEQSASDFGSGDYLMSGHSNGTKGTNSLDITGSVTHRWQRDWFIDKTGTLDGNANVIFDFSEGVTSPGSPTNESNYRLLYRAATSGNYSEVTTVSVSVVNGDQVAFEVSDTNLPDGYYTIGTTDNTNSPIAGAPGVIWYSRLSGDWNDPTIWTLDGSGFLVDNPSNSIPSSIDNVVVLNGRTVTMVTDNVDIAGIEIVGTLDVAATSGHNFTTISGNGTLRLSGAAGVDNFPDGSVGDFSDDFIGGTVEYYGTGITLPLARTFNNVIVDLNASSDELILLNDLTVNGDLTVTQGDFQLNNNSNTTILNLTVYGDVLVDASATVSVGQGSTIGSYSISSNLPSVGGYHSIFHQVTLWGDLTNSGSIRFTNQTAPDYSQFTSTGAATVRFKGSSNNTVTLFGTTDFYNLIIDKGSDRTFELEINSSSTSNFALYGPNNLTRLTGGTYTSVNAEVRKALWIYNGTLHLTGNIEIPTLTEGGNDYSVGGNGTLWIDGANVAVYSTADNASEAPTSAFGVDTGGGNQAFTLWGGFRISDGIFDTRGSAGFIFRNDNAGDVLIEGGSVSVSQFRSSVTGAGGIFTYTQTGGDVLVRANETGTGETNGSHALFSLETNNAVFNMSGGTLTVYGNIGEAIFINSGAGNYSVTGGTVNVVNGNGTGAIIASSAPFWNLNLSQDQTSDSGDMDLITMTSNSETIVNPDLIVLNDFTIGSGITFDHNGNDVEIGSDFIIETNADYVWDNTKRNTTTINGTNNSLLGFYNRDDINTTEQRFWNLIIDKPNDKTVSLASSKTDLNGTNNHLLRIDGDAFKLLSGTVDQGFYTIRVYADTLINYGILTIYNPANATPASTSNGNNDQIKFRPDDFVLITSDDAVFGNVRLNSTSQTITLRSNVKIDYLEYLSGRLDLNQYNLRVDKIELNPNSNADWNSCGGCYSVEDMIITNGSVSAGGLSLYVPADGLDPWDGDAIFDFPIGVGTDGIDADLSGGNSKYTPASIELSNVTDDGYITIRPVDQVLPTTDASGGTMLSYYWRVEHSGFTAPPNVVSLTFTGYEEDDGTGSASNYSSSWRGGKVLSVNPFTRTAEDNTSINNPSGHDINFDGNGTPFLLDNADYSAGPPNRFNGSPQIYYTRGLDRTNVQPDWNDPDTWTRSDRPGFDENNPHSSSNPASTDVPGVGDIVNIGFFPFDDPQAAYRGYPHSARVNSGDAVASVVIFTQMTDDLGNAPVERKPISDLGGSNDFQFRPTLTWNSTGSILISSIQGEGTIRIRGGSTVDAQRDPDFSSVDLGLFVNQDSSYLLYEAFNDYTINNVPDVVPNLTITNDGWGANDRSITINKSITVNQNLEIQGNSNLLLGNGTTGDIEVGNNLYLRPLSDGTGGGELRFSNSGTGRNITVNGDIYVGNPNGTACTGGNIIRVDGGGLVAHQLNIFGDIIINTTGSNGINGNGVQLGDGSESVVNINLQGATNNSMINLSGDVPQFHRILVNKGVNRSNTFTFENNFTLNGSTNGATKALVLNNGTIILNDPDIDIDLSSGGGDFNIASSATLQITQGIANVSGDDTGIILDGAIIIDGGTLNMDDAVGNGNNFIQYSASGSAEINVSSGNLLVGSQIRRNTLTASGILKYSQTGGTVEVGINNAPEATRGVFEIQDTGSEFTYTGGTLTLVRQNTTSPSVAALRLLPTTYDVTETIYIGNINTPASQSNFGINSNIPLAGLTINGANSPTATIQVNDLTLSGTLSIESSNTLDGNGKTLSISGDFENNGIYLPNSNITVFNSSSSQELRGTSSTDFFQLTKQELGDLEIITNDITVNGLFNHEEGIINDNGNMIHLLGNAVIEGDHNSLTGGGLSFEGSVEQQLLRLSGGTSDLGIVIIDNSNGVVIPEGNGYDFNINGELALNGGLFNIGSSSITVGQNADITTSSSYSVSNMVTTNSSFTDNGLTKVFPAGYTTSFTFPIGETFYTPVNVDFSVAGGTSGSTVGSISARPANEYHPTINDGNNFYTFDPDNVLQYYWSVNSSGINGLVADIDFIYDQSHVSEVDGAVSEATYIAARILTVDNATNDINKYTTSEVDESSNTISFPSTLVFNGVNSNAISGDYFAGDDNAIPDNVATYTSQLALGDVTNTLTFVEGLPTDGLAPSGAVLVVSSGTEVTFNVDNVQLYKTIIESDGTLNIDDTDGHRLGLLEGTGNLKITSNGINASLPAADYGTFFSCSGGGLEYAGTGSYSILPGITSLRNLVLSGSGDRNFPNNDVTICEDLIIDGPTVLNGNNTNIFINNDLEVNSGTFFAGTGLFRVNGDVRIQGGTFDAQNGGNTILNGNVSLNSGDFNIGTAGRVFIRGNLNRSTGTLTGSGTASIRMDGSVLQSISGDFTGLSASIYRLEVRNSNGILCVNPIEVENLLSLSQGIISGDVLISGSISPSIGRSDSYINGKLSKTISSRFDFPIGSANNWRPTSVNNVSTGGLTWEAEFFQQDVVANTIVSNMTPTSSSIATMQQGEYWVISDGNTAPSGVTATIGLSWGVESDVSSVSSEREKLEVMVWNDGTSTWDNLGGATFSSGHTQSAGTFRATSTASFSENIFALGSGDAANPLPIVLKSFNGRREGDINILTWITSSEFNNDYFELQRSGDGIIFETIAVINGAGTTQNESTYSFDDTNPLIDKNYYQLVQVDYDGTLTIAEKKVLLNFVPENMELDFSIFPNPTTELNINLRIKADSRDNVYVTVFDLYGKKVLSKVIETYELYQDVSLKADQALQQGIYLITIEQFGIIRSKRVIITK